MDEPDFFASHGRAGRQPGCQRQEKNSLVQKVFFKKKIIVVRLDADDADIMFPSTTAHVKLNYGGRKKKKIANNTRCSQAVTHPSTNRAQRCLTLLIRREPVLSTWYGR